MSRYASSLYNQHSLSGVIDRAYPQEKKLELRTAPSRFARTKKNFKNLETIVTDTCLKQEEEERARQHHNHISHLDKMMQMQNGQAPFPQKLTPLGAGVTPLLGDEPSNKKRRDRSCSLDEAKASSSAPPTKTDREDGPVAQPFQEKAKDSKSDRLTRLIRVDLLTQGAKRVGMA